MATRSLIGKVLPDGQIISIYCHFDGYPEGVGETLKTHYQDESKVDQLMALGNISSLAEEIGEAHDFNTCPSGQCNAYGRDGKESGNESIVSHSMQGFMNLANGSCAEYIYIYVNGEWRFSRVTDQFRTTEPL